MNATALTLSLLITSPFCYHPGIFYSGGSHAACKDDGAMRGGKGVVLSLALTGLAGGMAKQLPPREPTRGEVSTQKTGDPRDLLRAYEAAVRALEEDSRLPEALYRKAIALEGLFLFDAARFVWQELEQMPTWAPTAEKKIEALDQSQGVGAWSEQEAALRVDLREAALQGDTDGVVAIVDQYRQMAREYAELQLFGDWGEAFRKGQVKTAEEHLNVLRAVGDALARTNGELLVQDSVAVLDEAASTGDSQRLNELAQGARDLREGYKAYRIRHSDSAIPRLTTAHEALSRARCPLALRAALYLVSDDYVSRKYQAAADGAALLARHIKKLPYGALQAHAYWINGMAQATLGKTREAIEALEMSFTGFDRLGESENAANINCRLGEVFMSRGRRSEAWDVIYRALRSIPTLRDPDKVAAVYMIAGNAALQDGFDDAALVFQEERVRQTRLNPENFLAQVEALTWLARFQHHQGDDTGAQASLQEARQLLDNLGKVEPKQRSRREADLAMIQGMILEERNPVRAAELLSSALTTYQSEKNAIFSLWTLLARGRVHRRSGQDEAAERDFETAMKYYEEMGKTLENEDLRLALLEETDSLFDEMVSLQADGKNWDRALAYADRARTRILPGSASKLWTGLPNETSQLLASEAQPLSLDEIRRRLPQGVTLVQFSVSRDRILIWTLRRSGKGERSFAQQISREGLEDLVARFRAFDSQDWEKDSEELFKILIQPWLLTVPAEERIVFIPDKVLHWVTFSALKDPDSKRFLIQTHPLAIAPSATLYVNALERQETRPPRGSRGLVVGEPKIDRSVPGNEALVSLRAAKEEAQQLALRTGAPLLEGKNADKAAFLDAARRAEWIQFSGHAVIDPVNTLLSKLVLASGSNGDNGWLTAREIYSQKLKGTQLVVLAACDTGNEYVPEGEGVTSLARAFLAAGVPTVVASLWSVDDEATARLFEAFHTYYQESGDPVEALRKAQLKMLHSTNKNDKSPSAWAAFEVIGASADDQP